mmetsp:Transcript_9914/g.15959  ORF Transcript_9914/g.15959 Transcript_9914/m.15959 type:complete len:275 (+) Transcript_9914:11-835(+)
MCVYVCVCVCASTFLLLIIIIIASLLALSFLFRHFFCLVLNAVTSLTCRYELIDSSRIRITTIIIIFFGCRGLLIFVLPEALGPGNWEYALIVREGQEGVFCGLSDGSCRVSPLLLPLFIILRVVPKRDASGLPHLCPAAISSGVPCTLGLICCKEALWGPSFVLLLVLCSGYLLKVLALGSIDGIRIYETKSISSHIALECSVKRCFHIETGVSIHLQNIGPQALVEHDVKANQLKAEPPRVVEWEQLAVPRLNGVRDSDESLEDDVLHRAPE